MLKNFILPDAQIQVLVGREEAANVQSTVVYELVTEFRQCETDLWETVFERIQELREGRFVIKDAREMQTRFHCKFYTRIPIYYQKGVIAHAIKQANQYGGALIVAATGLEKTISFRQKLQ